jgi:uncharacterized membrane-anchored protein YitT (DUF2179 family)
MKLPKISTGMVKSAAAVVGGNMLYALMVKLFLLPAGLVTGGTTGLALIAEKLWNVPISGFVFVFNVVMLIIGWVVLGKAFALTTIASSVLYPLFLETCNLLLGDLVLTQDPMLCTVFFGVGIGVALGIVIRSGASTGGMDIPPLVLNKFFRLPVSVGLYTFDFCILLAQLFFSPAENVLYGIVMTLLYSIVIDKMLLLGQSRTELKIVSAKSEQITQAIMSQVDRGVTLLHGRGGYLGNETELVLTVISNRELVKVERLVHQIDPECFMVVSRVSEVRGRGFSLSKQYQ